VATTPCPCSLADPVADGGAAGGRLGSGGSLPVGPGVSSAGRETAGDDGASRGAGLEDIPEVGSAAGRRFAVPRFRSAKNVASTPAVSTAASSRWRRRVGMRAPC
jgi:hypothetical protein